MPELRLHLGVDVYGLWRRTEELLGRGTALPFWAFAWAGGQALARHVLDHPELVRGRRVLDLAAGSGLVAIAAARSGAAEVRTSDVDPLSDRATRLNAAGNGVQLGPAVGDVLAGDGGTAEVVLAGDVFYESGLGAVVLAFLERARARGARVLVGDPGRTYLPRLVFERLQTYTLPVADGLEDAAVKAVGVWTFRGAGARGRKRAVAGAAAPHTI